MIPAAAADPIREVYGAFAYIMPDGVPVIACLKDRSVVFGFAFDERSARDDSPLFLANARLVVQWGGTKSGVLGLSEVGPNAECSLSHTAPVVRLENVQAVFLVSPQAVRAFLAAPAAGREK